MNKPALINLKHLPYGGAQYVVADDLESFVLSAIKETADNNALQTPSVQEEFISNYLAWIKSSKRNTFFGLDDFPVAAFSAGTTEAFDKFYLKNSSRRLRYFRGEYMYHLVAARQYFAGGGEFLENGELTKDDAVVISLPFSDTGDVHRDMEVILAKCTALDIPVLIDCAYFGICSDITFNLNYKCITDVTFSLSKSFPVPHLRIGMRLTRFDDDDSLLVMNKTHYINRVSASIGVKILQHYEPDYIYDRFRAAQEALCKELNVDPSASVIFGIDKNNQYPEYNRGGTTNRLSLSKFLGKNKS